MFCIHRAILILACCTASGPARCEDDLFGLPENAAPEELYWEVLRLQAAGLLGEQEFARVQRELDIVDAHYATDTARDELVRGVLVAALRRTYRAVPTEEDAPSREAQEGRAYARRLHYAGVREAGRYAERALLIAGMLGVPTSKEELALIVVLPAGGYLVGKVVGLTYKKAALLLRKLRTPDEVLTGGSALGIRVERVESRAALERLIGKDAAASFWGHWNDYPKVTVNGQEYARVGNRLYSRHAVDRMQPSGMRYSGAGPDGSTAGMPQIRQAGGQYDYGRSVAPRHVEDAITTSRGAVQANGNVGPTCLALWRSS